MASIKERVSAMVTKVSDLKQTRDAADDLIKTLEKEKSLPDSAKAAIEKYGKNK